MRRLIAILPVAAFVIVLVGFMIGLKRDPAILPSMLIGKPLPAFALPPVKPMAAGLTSAELTGEPRLLNVFASWCGPCREEHPLLSRFANTGVTLVGVNYKDDPNNAKAWLVQLGDPYKTVVTDSNGRTGIDFGLYGVPESYLIDKQGVIRFKQIGPMTPEVIDQKILPMIKALNQ